MEPKEKAIELLNKYYNYLKFKNVSSYMYNLEFCKKFALICVDEILDYIGEKDYIFTSPQHDYWSEVRKEIENL